MDKYIAPQFYIEEIEFESYLVTASLAVNDNDDDRIDTIIE